MKICGCECQIANVHYLCGVANVFIKMKIVSLKKDGDSEIHVTKNWFTKKLALQRD